MSKQQGDEMKTPTQQLKARARRLTASHQARARKLGFTVDFSAADVEEMIERQPLCSYCKLPMALDCSLDHRVPIARGGSFCRYNLCLCCRRCNSLKGQLNDAEFAQLRDFLTDLAPPAQADLERRLLAGGARYGRRK